MPETTKIALDAMGGDIGPGAAIPAAAAVLKDNPSVEFLFFGDEKEIAMALSNFPALQKSSQIIHTDKKISSDEKPSNAIRLGKGSSMYLAIEAVRDGKADAIVSGGNTGALMALAKLILKSMPGVHRPALASIFPGTQGNSIMLDLGANVLVDAETLTQFAIMGAVFAGVQKKITTPTLGLLNVGTEDTKGPDHVKAAAAILKRLSFPGQYVGYVEGNDITVGKVDVIVCDGYAGNIALKAVEGTGKMLGEFLSRTLRADPLAILGGALSYFAFKRLKKQLDPRQYNGGVFLGLNGICVKSHGSSDEVGFATAIKLALNMAQQGYIQSTADQIAHLLTQENIVAEEMYRD
ncbi:MAG: phosphate acyltransferase PlsX [Alphaproteobacteria bacterium]